MEDSGKPKTLQDVVRRASARHDGRRGRGLEELAASMGYVLSRSTVDKILTGKYTSTPGKGTIDALAALAGLPVRDVYVAAEQPLPVGSLADLLPPDADLLSPDQRRVVVEMVRLLAQQQRVVHDLMRGREAGDRDAQEQQEAAPITQADELASRRPSAREDPPAPLAGAARATPDGGSAYDQVTRSIDETEEGEQE